MRYRPLRITIRRIVLALTILASLSLTLPRQTDACGPFFTDAIFVYTKHPDFPLDRFAQGQVGVVQASYARSYLLAAYRNLSGERLSEKEVAALKSLWDDRLNGGWSFDDNAWIKTWNDARSKVAGVSAPPQIRVYRNRAKPNEYESYLNCQQDAFESAANTLTERIKRYGADSNDVRIWVTAQDTVFANCGEGQSIPEPIASGANATASADRAYQIAAANFYAGNFDAAARQFDEIAGDRNSPWRDRSPYLAARSLIRKASLAEKVEDGKPALIEAERRLKSLKTEPAVRLLNLTRLRLRPEEKLHELAQLLTKRDRSADFKQDVWDYTVLLDKFLGEEGYDSSKQTSATPLRSDDATDWILNIQDESKDAFAHSLSRWEKTRSLVWLVAALTNAGGNSPQLQSLLEAASRVDTGSPAFASVTFHQVRLLADSGNPQGARRLVDQVLSTNRDKFPASTINLLLSQRQLLAQNLEEFLQSAQRVPSGFSDDSDGREIPEEDDAARETAKGSQYFFDVDSVKVFNQAMPAGMLTYAALSKTLAPNLHDEVAKAAFIRATLIDGFDQAVRASAVLAELHPELRGLLADYKRAPTPEARRFAAAYLSLKSPGLRPYVTSGIGRGTPIEEVDSFRDNWWCAQPPATLSGAPPAFLSASQPLAARQMATLQALGTGPNYLSRTVIDWTNKHPADPRAPEALHLAVKSTRYGCTDKETGRWSKAAFDLLHRRYPNSSWAKQTKYWFKD